MLNERRSWILGVMLLGVAACESDAAKPQSPAVAAAPPEAPAQPPAKATAKPAAKAAPKATAVGTHITLVAGHGGRLEVEAANHYTVDISKLGPLEDNRLLVIHVPASPRSHYYSVPVVAGRYEYEFSAKTARPTTGSPPFSGLKKRDSAFLLVGKEPREGALNGGMFQTQLSFSLAVR